MNKFIFPCVLLLLLTGCSPAADPVPEVTETTPVSSAAAGTSTTVPAEETETFFAAETTAAPAAEAETALPLSYDAYQVVYNIMEQNGEESGTFQGIGPDGNLIWTYETGTYPQGQMLQISPLGRFQGTYYLLANGTVIAVDITTGQILFENRDFGGCASQEVCLIDDYGYLYLCGFDKPDFFAMDPMGHTVKVISTLDKQYFGPFKITADKNILTVHMGQDKQGNSGDFPITIDMDWLPQAKG